MAGITIEQVVFHTAGFPDLVDAGLRGTMAYELFGLNYSTTFGLSTSKQRKAFNRGEITLNYDATGPYLKKVKKYEKKGTVAPYMAYGYFDKDGNIKRDLTFPNLPTVEEAYKAVYGKAPSGPNWDAFKNFMGIGVMASKAIALPKNASKEVIDTYQKVVKQIAADPKFKKIAEKRFGKLPISFGADAKKILKDATSIKPETRKWIKAFIKKKYDVNI